MTNSSGQRAGDACELFMSILQSTNSTCRNSKIYLFLRIKLTMQNEQDMEFQILHPLTDESVMQKWFKLVSQASPEVHYPPRYSIPQFPPEYTMVNVFPHRCCGSQSACHALFCATCWNQYVFLRMHIAYIQSFCTPFSEVICLVSINIYFSYFKRSILSFTKWMKKTL